MVSSGIGNKRGSGGPQLRCGASRRSRTQQEGCSWASYTLIKHERSLSLHHGSQDGRNSDARFGDSVDQAAGLSLHAGVAARTDERRKLERLCRTISRPANSEKRLSLTPSGYERYELKTPVCPEYSCRLRYIVMMKSPCAWELDNFSGARRPDIPTVGCAHFE